MVQFLVQRLARLGKAGEMGSLSVSLPMRGAERKSDYTIDSVFVVSAGRFTETGEFR
jgi:hypothetical protein